MILWLPIAIMFCFFMWLSFKAGYSAAIVDWVLENELAGREDHH